MSAEAVLFAVFLVPIAAAIFLICAQLITLWRLGNLLGGHPHPYIYPPEPPVQQWLEEAHARDVRENGT